MAATWSLFFLYTTVRHPHQHIHGCILERDCGTSRKRFRIDSGPITASGFGLIAFWWNAMLCAATGLHFPANARRTESPVSVSMKQSYSRAKVAKTGTTSAQILRATSPSTFLPVVNRQAGLKSLGKHPWSRKSCLFLIAGKCYALLGLSFFRFFLFFPLFILPTPNGGYTSYQAPYLDNWTNVALGAIWTTRGAFFSLFNRKTGIQEHAASRTAMPPYM